MYPQYHHLLCLNRKFYEIICSLFSSVYQQREQMNWFFIIWRWICVPTAEQRLTIFKRRSTCGFTRHWSTKRFRCSFNQYHYFFMKILLMIIMITTTIITIIIITTSFTGAVSNSLPCQLGSSSHPRLLQTAGFLDQIDESFTLSSKV